MIALLTASAYFAGGPDGFSDCYNRSIDRINANDEARREYALSECSSQLIIPIGLLVGAVWVAWKGLSIRA